MDPQATQTMAVATVVLPPAPVGLARRPLTHHALMAARMGARRLRRRPVAPEGLAWALAEVRRCGIAIVEDFLSAAACAQLRQATDALLERHAAGVAVDRWGADHRLYLDATLSGPLGDIARHPTLQQLADTALRGPAVNAGLLVARLDARAGNPGSGGGWHRDSFLSQVKTLIYLDEVDADHGPFQYLLDSHRLGAKLRDRRRAGLGWRQRRVPDVAIERLLAAAPERLRTVTGRAGTLVLADTTGVHRGMPIRQGRRYALTNYFYPAWQVDARLRAHLRPMLVPAPATA